jgi:hypothetical protein
MKPVRYDRNELLIQIARAESAETSLRRYMQDHAYDKAFTARLNARLDELARPSEDIDSVVDRVISLAASCALTRLQQAIDEAAS